MCFRGEFPVKRVFGLVFIFVAASFVSGASVATPAEMTAAQRASARTAAAAAAKGAAAAADKAAAAVAAIKLLAPADEYFGPLKQSVIGIRNAIRVLGWNYDVNHDIGVQTVASAGLTERAIRDWESKYPRDGQVARALFLLQRLYTKVLTQDARNHAHSIANWLFSAYAKSPQAKQLHKTLAVEHLAPLPAPAVASTTAPAYQSVFGAQYPSVFNATPATAPAPAAGSSAAPAPAGSAQH
jgi:hypothetical protein